MPTVQRDLRFFQDFVLPFFFLLAAAHHVYGFTLWVFSSVDSDPLVVAGNRFNAYVREQFPHARDLMPVWVHWCYSWLKAVTVGLMAYFWSVMMTGTTFFT